MLLSGYIIFTVFGELPECDAESAFKSLRRDQDGKYIDELMETPGHRLGSTRSEVLELPGGGPAEPKNSTEDIRKQREQFLQRFNKSSAAASSGDSPNSSIK